MITDEDVRLTAVTRFEGFLTFDDELPTDDRTDEVVERPSDEPLDVLPPTGTDDGDDQSGEDAGDGADGESDDVSQHTKVIPRASTERARGEQGSQDPSQAGE